LFRRFARNDAAKPANAQPADLDADHDHDELPHFTSSLSSLWPGLPQEMVLGKVLRKAEPSPVYLIC
jgi:hypothetical protein